MFEYLCFWWKLIFVIFILLLFLSQVKRKNVTKKEWHKYKIPIFSEGGEIMVVALLEYTAFKIQFHHLSQYGKCTHPDLAILH